MKTAIISIVLLSAFCLINTALSGQSNKVEGPLQNFVNTGFMLRFKDLKIEAEAAVRRFKAQSHELAPADVQKVQTGYEQSAYRFNQLLTNIKGDFMNPKKLKYIGEFPDDYQRSLELELHQLSEFYALHFLQPLADATGKQMDGGPVLLLVMEMVGLTKGLIHFFTQSRQQARRFSEAYLQQNLIQPFKFRSWDEVGPEGSMSPAEEVYTPDMMEPPSLDPLLQEASQLLQMPVDQPVDEFDGANTYDEWLEQNEQPVESPQDSVSAPTGLKPAPTKAKPASGAEKPISPVKEGAGKETAAPKKKKEGNE